MAWVIVKDHVNKSNCTAVGTGSKEGSNAFTHGEGLEERLPRLFRVRDDDRELYYEGRCDERAIEYDQCRGGLHGALTWAMDDVGATILELFDPRTRRWECVYS